MKIIKLINIKKGDFHEDKKSGHGILCEERKEIIVSNYIDNKIIGDSLIIRKDSEEYCKKFEDKNFNSNGEDEECIRFKEKDNYKELKDFYESKKNLLAKYKIFNF